MMAEKGWLWQFLTEGLRVKSRKSRKLFLSERVLWNETLNSVRNKNLGILKRRRFLRVLVWEFLERVLVTLRQNCVQLLWYDWSEFAQLASHVVKGLIILRQEELFKSAAGTYGNFLKLAADPAKSPLTTNRNRNSLDPEIKPREAKV